MHRLRAVTMALFLALSLSGCMQLDINVRLEEDGSATITERLRYSSRLLDMEAELPDGEGMKGFLAKKSAESRAAQMGKGANLASHKLDQTEDGGLESVAVYTVPHLEDVRLVFPYLGYGDHTKREVIFELKPCYYSAGRERFWEDQPGWMEIHLGKTQYQPKLPKQPELTPLERQKLRKLLPVFQDLMRDFQVKVYFTGYSPVRCGGYLAWKKGDSRGDPIRASDFFELLDIKGDQLDDNGAPFVDNEELMIDLMRGDFASDRVLELAKNWPEKDRTPIYRPDGKYHSIYLLPSEYFYMKYFDGKPEEMIFDGVTLNQDRLYRKREK